MQRSIGFVGYTFIGVSGIIGSGWLFGPLLTAQLAGPASLISWLIGAAGMLLLALCYAEVSAMLPVAGGIARIPHFTHGKLSAYLLGWTAWMGYNTAAPIETIAMLQYLNVYFPWLYIGPGSQGELSLAGQATALSLLIMFVIINALGARFFAHINTSITWLKLFIPLAIGVLLMVYHFEPDNFTRMGGFAPYGVHGILSAISAGGIIFAFLGFRHAIDMAGEVRNPQTTIPLALGLTIVICMLVYLVLQVAFIGSLSAEDLDKGWKGLHFGHRLGPIAGVVAALGIGWMSSMLYAGAIAGPLGASLVATGSNARIAQALSKTGLLPPSFSVLSSRSVPLNALLLNLVIGAVVVLWVPFKEAVALNGAAISLSLCAGPLAVYCLRLQIPDAERRFRLPYAGFLSYTGFTLVTLIIYWSGWDTTWRLGLIMLAGVILVMLRQRFTNSKHVDLDLANARWLLAYCAGLGLFSYLGDFSGGLGILPFGWDLLVGIALSVSVFAYAVRCRLPNELVEQQVRTIAGHHD